VILEVRIPKELVNWQTKQAEQLKSKAYTQSRRGEAKIQKQDLKSKVKTPLDLRATRRPLVKEKYTRMRGPLHD